jgi:hypothetical protein
MPVGELELVSGPHATQPWTAFDTSAGEAAAIQVRSLGAIAGRRLPKNKLPSPLPPFELREASGH